METNLKVTDLVSNSRKKDIFNDAATRSKISRHLTDINDTITEDDIRNIKVSIADTRFQYLVGNTNTSNNSNRSL